jgi:hypothetical protein
MAFSPNATPQEALTAMRYDLMIVCVESGVDLFAFALLIATLSDWFVICHPSVPHVCAMPRQNTYSHARIVGNSYPEPRREHARRDNQVRENKT